MRRCYRISGNRSFEGRSPGGGREGEKAGPAGPKTPQRPGPTKPTHAALAAQEAPGAGPQADGQSGASREQKTDPNARRGGPPRRGGGQRPKRKGGGQRHPLGLTLARAATLAGGRPGNGRLGAAQATGRPEGRPDCR